MCGAQRDTRSKHLATAKHRDNLHAVQLEAAIVPSGSTQFQNLTLTLMTVLCSVFVSRSLFCSILAGFMCNQYFILYIGRRFYTKYQLKS